jgi:glycosyltransferase involved in cell wall biosynthesis
VNSQGFERFTDRESLTLAFVAHPNSIHTRRWAGWFERAGHEVVIVDPVGVELQPGLPAGIRVEQPRQLRRALLALRPDVVHAHYLARFGWQAARAGVRPLVMTPWGSDLLQVGRWKLRTRIWNRLALRRADLVTVSSDGMRDAAAAAGARPDRIRLIRHGVDTTGFAPGQASHPLLARLAVGRAPVILSPRSVTPIYHHEVVLAAVAQVGRHRDPPPILVVTTAGADAATMTDLRERAVAEGIDDRLYVLEEVPADALPDLYRSADVVVSVPETDSFAVTLLEAMATGLPVVATDLPAVTPVLGSLDPVARELIVPIGDVGSTASAIEIALGLTEDERGRLGAEMRRYVVEHAEYDTNMASMESIYRELARSRPR